MIFPAEFFGRIVVYHDVGIDPVAFNDPALALFRVGRALHVATIVALALTGVGAGGFGASLAQAGGASRKTARGATAAAGLTLVVFLLLLVISFVRGLELSLNQSGDPDVVLLHSANSAENLENSSISETIGPRKV